MAGFIVKSAAGCIVLALTAFTAPVAKAQDCAEAASREVPRVVLALYDGQREPDPRESRIHLSVEMPLNYLGYVVQYRDVSEDLPPLALPAEVAATVSWFDEPLVEDSDFTAWAAQVERECGGLLQIAFGDTGIRPELSYDGQRDRYLARLGVVAGPETALGVLSHVVGTEAGLIGAETPFDIEPGIYPAFRAAPGAQSLLRVAPFAESEEGAFDLAVAGPRGAYVDTSVTLRHDARAKASFWILDPFAFLERVLGFRGDPVPDVTTSGGRRMYFATVRPEGWLIPEPARRFGEGTKIGAELMLERLIAPWPDLPVSVAVLTGDLDVGQAGQEAMRGEAVARELFRLPQVQIGTSGHSLLRTWGFYSAYDRDREARMMQQLRAASLAGGTDTGLVNAAVRTLEIAMAEPMSFATARIPGAPRRYMRDAFDLAQETTGALAEAASLGNGRPAAYYLWTGDARPFEAALQRVSEAGAAALGGGGGVYNRFSPALSNLAPFGIEVGRQLQVHNALSGDEAYTDYWTGALHGYQQFRDTLAQTETPRRLRPFQLAFAPRSAIAFGSRRAVESMLEYARQAEVQPVTAADYASIVGGFYSLRTDRDGPLSWRIRDRGALQTLRFDRAAGLALDLTQSRGVIGATRKDDTLYVSLEPTTAEPLVVLTEDAIPGGMIGTDRRPGLSSSRFVVLAAAGEACHLDLRLRGWGPGDMSWIAPPATSFAINVRQEGAIIATGSAIAGPDGRLDVALPDPRGEAFDVTLDGAC